MNGNGCSWEDMDWEHILDTVRQRLYGLLNYQSLRWGGKFLSNSMPLGCQSVQSLSLVKVKKEDKWKNE